jgi:hypothetical protein
LVTQRVSVQASRLPAPRHGRRAAHHDESELARDLRGDHVPVDHLAELDPGVVPRGHDVHRRIPQRDVEVGARARAG